METETRKCIVDGCQNHTDQGQFIGDLCFPCYHMVTEGKIGYGTTFIHELLQKIRGSFRVVQKELDRIDGSV